MGLSTTVHVAMGSANEVLHPMLEGNLEGDEGSPDSAVRRQRYIYAFSIATGDTSKSYQYRWKGHR